MDTLNIDKLKAAFEYATFWMQLGEEYYNTLSPNQVFRLKAVLRNVGSDYLLIARHVLKQGMCIDVALHTIKASTALKGEVRFSDEIKNYLANGISVSGGEINSVLQIHLLELAGKVAFLRQEDASWLARITRKVIASDKLEYCGCSFPTLDTAVDALVDGERLKWQWDAWPENAEFIDQVKTEMSTLLKSLGDNIPSSNIETISKLVDEGHCLRFPDYYFDDELAKSIREAEAVNALLMRVELDQEMPNSLLKDTLEDERRALDNWNNNQELIVHVKRDLAKRIQGLLADEDSLEKLSTDLER